MDEQFPDGFDCDECYINGVSTWAQDNAELFTDPKTAGTDATISAVQGVTGLKIKYWAMRSEARRVGTECVRTCRSRRSPRTYNTEPATHCYTSYILKLIYGS